MTDGTTTTARATEDAFVDVETLGFEQAQAELESIVQRLEDPRTGLDQALVLWERGEALHAWCQARLDNAQARIEKLQLTPEEQAAAQAEAAGPDDFAHEPAAAAPQVDDAAADDDVAPAEGDGLF